MNQAELATKTCKTREQGLVRMSSEEIAGMLDKLPGWSLREGASSKIFKFSGYAQTIAFVNATVWISERADHHPELTVGYATCRVEYSTHSVQGISENDFICAAKIDALFAL